MLSQSQANGSNCIGSEVPSIGLAHARRDWWLLALGGNQHTQTPPEYPSLPLSDQAQLAVPSLALIFSATFYTRLLHSSRLALHHCRTQWATAEPACF